MLIKYPITLNCKKTNIQKRIKANTGEGNERELIITLTDGDKKLNLYNRGLVAAIVGVKPDGTKFSNSAVIAEDNTIRYTLTTQNVATEGTVDCQVRILDSVDTGVLFSAKFSIEVEANLSNEEAEESSNEWTELIAALDQVYKQVTVYQGSGAPTGTDFENIKVSDFYYDTLNEDYYYCTEIHTAGGGEVIVEIIWKKLLNSIPEEYVKFSDYPTYQKAGVVKKGSGFEVDENGAAIGVAYGPETVPILSGRTIMSKTTVLNLIDYLELVNETQLQEGLDDKQDIMSAGNGIDITGTTISAKVRDLSDNALTNNQNGLYVSKYTLGYDTNLRQNLADTAASNALASKAYVDELMSGAVKRLVVQTLPVSDIDENTIYMVPKTTAETNNIYDEYMYINNAWELIGTTEVDLSNYYTKTQTDSLLSDKQDKLRAGNGITLTNGITDFSEISVKLKPGTAFLNFNFSKELYLNDVNLARNEDFRNNLADDDYLGALARKYDLYEMVPLPEYGDEGKVLRVDNDGFTEWNNLADKQDTLTAGDGIVIENDEISVDTDEIATNESVDEKIAEIPQPRPITDTAKGTAITLTDSENAPIKELYIMGKSTQNGTPSIDNPIPIVDASSEVDVTGKNLITLSELTKGIDITNGSISVTDKIKLTCSTDGNVRSSVYKGQGATYSSQERARSLFIPINYNVPIVLSLQNGVFDFVYGIITDQNYKVIGQSFFSLGTQSGKKYTPLENERFMCLQFGKNNATAGNTYSDNIQIEIGQSPTPFEFYKNLQKTAYTPILRGIPVSSGGNYTDNNNQQWLCDTIERYANGTGKLIQRVGYIASYNGETITTQYMSSTGGLNTGSTIIYILATPTETPLTAEQLEELKLDTYYPTSNINSNADVVVEYVCDTKNYIDKKTS